MTNRMTWFQGMGRRLGLFVLVWMGITLWHHDVLWLPPYEEQCTGLWYEVDFLVETGYDYRRLRYDEPHFMSPKLGARSYMVSLVPTLFALLIQACPSLPVTYFVGHLLTFALASIVTVALFGMLRPTIGLLSAVLVCVAMLATPCFAVQIEMLGMEIPMVAFSTAAAWALWKKRYGWAALLSTLGFLMKVNGIVVTAASAAYLFYQYFMAVNDRESKRSLFRGLTLHGVALAFQLGLSLWGDTSLEARGEVRSRYGGMNGILGIRNAIYWCPDVVLVFFVGLFALLIGLLYRRTGTREVDTVRWRWRAEDGTNVTALLWVGWLVTLLWTASMASYIFTPRYAAGGVPFLYLAVGVTLFRLPWRPSIPRVLFLALIALNLTNASGQFLPSIATVGKETFAENPFTRPRWCILLERSREYLPDLRANLEAMGRLEREHAGVAMCMTGPYAFYAALPRLGYVEEPLRVERVASYPEALRALERYAKTPEAAETGLSPVFVWFGAALAFFPPPEPGDKVLIEDRSPYPVKFYRKPLNATESVADWYLRKTWAATDRSEASFGRIAYLREKGDQPRLLEELRCLMKRYPQDRRFRILFDNIRGANEQAEKNQVGNAR